MPLLEVITVIKVTGYHSDNLFKGLHGLLVFEQIGNLGNLYEHS
jgi:hypothetical protein